MGLTPSSDFCLQQFILFPWSDLKESSSIYEKKIPHTEDTETLDPREIPWSSPASPWKTLSFPPLLSSGMTTHWTSGGWGKLTPTSSMTWYRKVSDRCCNRYPKLMPGCLAFTVKAWLLICSIFDISVDKLHTYVWVRHMWNYISLHWNIGDSWLEDTFL